MPRSLHIRIAVLLLLAVVVSASGIVTALIPAGVPAASKQGNGGKFQLSTGSTTTDNCVKFDASGNTVDAGAACGGGGGSGIPFWPTIVAPPTIAGGTWTQIDNGGTATFADITGGISITAPSANADLKAVVRAPGAGAAFTLTAKVMSSCSLNNFRQWGVVVSDGTKYEVFGGSSNSTNTTWIAQVGAWTNNTTATTPRYSGTAAADTYPNLTEVFFRVVYDGTNLAYQFSPIGTSGTFYQLYTEVANTFLAAPSKIGYYVDNQTATHTCQADLVHWNVTNP